MKPFAPVTKTCIFALPRWSRRPSIELDHAARHRAGHQQAKALVYLVEFVGAADQIVEIELLVHVEIGEDWEIDVGTHRTVVGAADCLSPNTILNGLIGARTAKAGIPTSTACPPGATASSACSAVASPPIASKAASTPSPLVSALTCLITSPSLAFMVCVAPKLFA